ncbi:MAG: cell division protein FtsZ [Bacteroidetes bacterium]|nr:cell division protein FtsZ [Bacteroidota bacterium]
MKFDLPEQSSIIKVIGVGGGGSNAVNHMYRAGIKGVDFVVCNTDKQALDMSPVPFKVVLGTTLTEGRGAGSIPEVGRNAAIENIEDIRTILANNTKMVFITAGMGGGTGTGAAPIIAGIAKEMGILTVAIVTVPFLFEGKKRRAQAEDGIEQLKQNVDTLLVICNDKLREMYGNLKLSDAFSHADDVLTIAAKSIAEVISLTQQINVDFADVCTVMKNSGVAIMGSAMASGENRAIRAVETSLNSPLLNDNNIIGARYVLLNIISGANEITMDELGEITDYIQEAAGQTAEIIKGYGVEPSYGDAVNVTIIATGFNQNNSAGYEYTRKTAEQKIVRSLVEPEIVEEKKEEPKVELANPLEPFLIHKQPDPQPEIKAEEIVEEKTEERANPLEPFLKSESTEEIISETVSAEVTNPLEPFLVANTAETVSEISSEPVAEVQEEKTEEVVVSEATPEIITEVSSEPVAETTTPENTTEEISSMPEFTLSTTSEETVTAEEQPEPVMNTEVEFEITNLNSSGEEKAVEWNNEPVWNDSSLVNETEKEVTAELPARMTQSDAENNISASTEVVPEIQAETTETPEVVMEKQEEIASVSEPVAEISSVNEPVLITKEEPVAETPSQETIDAEEEARRIKIIEQEKKAQERIQRLKELSMKLKTPQALNEMEKEPAYKRRNITLENVPHSSESQISRFTLTENEDKKIEIRPNNSFLHDNVD